MRGSGAFDQASGEADLSDENPLPLEPQPANPGVRLGAGLIDIAVVGVGGVLYTTVFGSRQPKEGISMTVSDNTVNGGGVWLFIGLALAYFLLMELGFGATLGKLATGLRVTMANGDRLTSGAAVVRTVFRPVDGLPYLIPNLLGFIVVASTPKNQRIGDIVARTVVVRRVAP